MGTRPIFESDFDCLTDFMPIMSYHSRLVSKGKGEIQMIIGPMFSGKSTELQRRLNRCQFALLKCLVIKYEKDDRYDDEKMCTHDGKTCPAVKASKLNSIAPACDPFDVIGIDEGQFFPDIVEFSENQANRGKVIIIAALDGTFQRQPFPKIMELIPLSESVVKLNAVCMSCRCEAAFSRRLGNETEVEVIGAEDKYMSVCRRCYNLPDIKSPHKNPRKMPLNQFDSNLIDQPKRKLFKEGDEKTVPK